MNMPALIESRGTPSCKMHAIDQDPFYQQDSTLIPALTSNHLHSQVWD